MTPREVTVDIGAFTLENGDVLADVKQHVAIYGEPNADGSNVALVPHALTGTARIADWWPALLAPGAPLDVRAWCVVGVNLLGGCDGSTGPREISPFPRVTVRDAVLAQRRALEQLGIAHVHIAIGASLGGMQALEWALQFPDSVDRAIVIGAHDHRTPMGIAFSAIQREAIALDPVRGLRIARKLGTLTYKSDALFAQRHGRRRDRQGRDMYDVEGYLEYMADKFESRNMDPRSYIALTHTMDSHDALEDRGAHAPVTFIGISSDWLFRPEDIRAAAARFDASYYELASDHGHDAFLADADQLAHLLRPLIVLAATV